MKVHPVFALTMGDPAGIGPEITLKALSSNQLPPSANIIVIGDLSVLAKAALYVSQTLPLHAMTSLQDFKPHHINIMDMGEIGTHDFTPGIVSARCGKASYAYILKSISLAQSGDIDGVITNPINKSALKAAGINFAGHTEIFAHETGTENFSMVFKLGSVSVIHVTTHCSIKKALELITQQRVYRNIQLIHRTLQSLGNESPRIAVGGLNPHAGEDGLFGDEEILHIIPAIQQAKKAGMKICGPLPPDTVFMKAFNGEFDAVVSMLHDHGFVALKSRDFEHGVNITVGLPIIRTSVGHGTAFDIAGKGIASEKSLIEAIRAACEMSKKRQRQSE